jgi:hypothetical protein
MKTSKRNFRGFLFLLENKNTILYLFYPKFKMNNSSDNNRLYKRNTSENKIHLRI